MSHTFQQTRRERRRHRASKAPSKFTVDLIQAVVFSLVLVGLLLLSGPLNDTIHNATKTLYELFASG